MANGSSLQGWLKRLAVIAVGLTSGNFAAASAELASIPESTVLALIEESEQDSWDDARRLRVLNLLARDPRARVRLDVAASLKVRPDAALSGPAEALVAWLVDDPSPAVSLLAAQDLVALLRQLRPIERTHLVARWAFDPRARKRQALARALGGSGEIVGARTALEHLANDQFPQVRAAAVEARELHDALRRARARLG